MKYLRLADWMAPEPLSGDFIIRARSGCLVILLRKLFTMDRYISRGINPYTNLITFDTKNSDCDIVTDDQRLVNPPCENKHRQLPCLLDTGSDYTSVLRFSSLRLIKPER